MAFYQMAKPTPGAKNIEQEQPVEQHTQSSTTEAIVEEDAYGGGWINVLIKEEKEQYEEN